MGLVLLILMGVVVALVMSVASRSLSDTALSRQERESSAAFSLAESGVESAMNALRDNQGSQIVGDLTGLSGFVSGQFNAEPTSAYSLFVREGETASLDLTGYNTANPLVISWTKTADTSENVACSGEGSGLSPAAIELAAVVSSTSTQKLKYYNPYNCNAVSASGFGVSLAGDGGYRSKISYSVPTSSTEIRIKPIYSGATIAVSGAGLTSQLYLIQSKAAGGDAQKEIEVKRGLDAPPSLFDFAVYSAGTVVK